MVTATPSSSAPFTAFGIALNQRLVTQLADIARGHQQALKIS
nr:hypothetical protein [Nostoc sp. ChiQUE02]MDZ8232715.1 hypothetical protein [Nostoc sp. ChiQUE02]